MTSAVPPLALSSKASTYAVSASARVFEDPGQTSFKEVRQMFNAGQGKVPDSSDEVFIGYSSKPHWVVFNVFNRNQAKSRWILDFGNRATGTIGVVNKLSIYSVADNDVESDKPLMSDGRLVKNKLHIVGQERNALPLNLDPGHYKTIAFYIEPAPGVPLSLSPQLEEQAVYTSAQDQVAMWNNFVKVGAILAACIYLVFWINYRKPIPLLLIAYVGLQYLIYTCTDEIVPYGNNTTAQYLDIVYALSAFVALMLARFVLYSRFRKDQNRIILNLVAIAVPVMVVLASLVDIAAGIAATMFVRLGPVLIPGLLMGLGATAAAKGNRPQSAAFATSWFILLLGAMITEAAYSGFVHYSPAIAYTYWIAFILHLTVISFASLRYVAVSEEMLRHEQAEMKRKREDEAELRKTKEIADQTRMLGVMTREKELMADLRNREGERLQALRRAKETADSANKAKSDFLAVISHEIRTPMTGIMGMIRLLLDSPLSEKQKEFARTIQYSGDALLTLLNDILDLSKVEEGKMTIESIDFDLGKLVESVVLLMSGRAEEKKIYLKAEIDPECPLVLKGDPNRVRQILLNLIGNAIKFTEKGGVTVIIKAHDKTAKKPRIYFGVKDTGIGISEDVQKKLFQPYQQADASTARKFGGTGLGLSICKRLVEAMGSSIQIASKMGEGTVFYFILALDYGVTEAQAAQAAAAIGVIPLKILVVDDNIINQRVVAGLLEKDGHKILTVSGAEQAIAEIKSKPFDVVLMDMEMPQIDGVLGTQMIRRLPDPVQAKVTVIAMTANTRKEDIQRCRDAGMDDYVSKPVNPEALRKLLIQFGKRKYPNQQPVVPGAAAPSAAPPPAAPAPTAPATVATASTAPGATVDAKEEFPNLDGDIAVTAPVAAAPPVVAAAPPPAAEAAPAAAPHGANGAAPPAAPAPTPAPQATPAELIAFEQQKLFSIEVLGGLKGSLGKDAMDEMMDGLYQKTEELIGAAEKAVEEKDTKALIGRGHDIKGMTSNFGLTALAELGGRLERQAKENFSVDTLGDIVRKLRPIYYDTRSIVDKWMKLN